VRRVRATGGVKRTQRALGRCIEPRNDDDCSGSITLRGGWTAVLLRYGEQKKPGRGRRPTRRCKGFLGTRESLRGF
jgi:hypothetical protein